MSLKTLIDVSGNWEIFAEECFRLKWVNDNNYRKIWAASFEENPLTTSYLWKQSRDEFMDSKLKMYNKILIPVIRSNKKVSDLEEELIDALIPEFENLYTIGLDVNFELTFLKKLIFMIVFIKMNVINTISKDGGAK